MALREILAVFGAEFDTSALDKGNKAVEGGVEKLKQFGAAVGAAFAFDKLKDFTLEMVKQADDLGDQAARLNISTEALQQWRYAAGFAELSGDALDGIFQKLSVNAAGAADGGKEQAAAFKKIGVSAKDTGGHLKTADKLFEEVGLGLSGMTDETEKTALAVKLFGRANASRVLQVFKDGAPGIAALREEFEELGAGFREDFIQEASEADDQMKRLNLAWTSAKTRIAGYLLPALNNLLAAFISLSIWFRKTADSSNLLTAAWATFLGIALAGALKLAVAYAPIIGTTLLWAAAIALATLAVEDLITAWKGGDSLIGRAIDRLFGPGSLANTRAWIKETAAGFSQFFSDLANDPIAFSQNWDRTIASVRKDLDELGPFWGSIANGMLNAGLEFFTVISSGWSGMVAEVELIGAQIKGVWALLGLAIIGTAYEAAAAVEDRFIDMRNTVAAALQGVLQQAAAVASKIPGAGALSEGLQNGISALAPIAADSGERARAVVEKSRARILGDVDSAQQRRDAAVSVVANTPVTVNVAAGTPSNQVAALKAGAGEGARAGTNRGTAAALERRAPGGQVTGHVATFRSNK